MAQNIYDNPEFFAGYSQLPRQVHGLDAAPEWPAVRAMLPDLRGKRIVDLGCGFGWFGRWAREHGAVSVLGLDISANMLTRAKANTPDCATDYRVADLEALELPEASFDLAYSALTFHYVEDFGRLTRGIHRALVPGAHFVFTVEHPIVTAPIPAGWSVGPDGRKTWPVNSYQKEGPRRTNWLAEGVIKQHRTLGTLLNLLIGLGFTILHVEEWAPNDAQIAAHPEWAEEYERPMFLLIAVQR
jgi:SAM-dependent methyltransferase